MFDQDALFKWIGNFFFYLITIVDFDKMIILENFEFFKFVEIVLFFFMNELYQL